MDFHRIIIHKFFMLCKNTLLQNASLLLNRFFKQTWLTKWQSIDKINQNKKMSFTTYSRALWAFTPGSTRRIDQLYRVTFSCATRSSLSNENENCTCHEDILLNRRNGGVSQESNLLRIHSSVKIALIAKYASQNTSTFDNFLT